jgi:ATP-dependent exoDNAse (exonuclease V) beta subunit
MKKYFNHHVKKAIVVQSLITIESLELSSTFSYPREVHEFYEFAYIDDGNLSCKLDDETIELSSNSGEGEDAVNIMTVHKSKGLEYPVCFLAGAESATRRTNSARIVYSQAYGIGIREKDESGLAIVENPIFNTALNEDEAYADYLVGKVVCDKQ